ncbi:MAG: Lrp/AsnC ligand binding domain-containing protein [Candidatus Odinarchaeia archaeon]
MRKNCLVLNVTGEYDFLVLAKCKNDEEGAQFINQVRQIERVDRVTSHYILKIYKEI